MSSKTLFQNLPDFLGLQQKLQVSYLLDMFVEANLNKTLSYLIGDKKLVGYIVRALNEYGPEDVYKSVEVYTKISPQVTWAMGMSATGALGFFKDPEESNIGNFHVCLPIKTMLKNVAPNHPVTLEYWSQMGLLKASAPVEDTLEIDYSKKSAIKGAIMLNNLLSKIQEAPLVPDLLRLLLAYKMTKEVVEGSKGFMYDDAAKVLKGLVTSRNSEGKSLWEIPWGKLSSGKMATSFGVHLNTDELPPTYLSTYCMVQPLSRKYVEKFWRDATSKSK